jgi:predicted RNase H-like HicB family nuclease
MKAVYPAILTKIEDGYLVTVPDFPLNTHGKDLTEALFMARDAIGLTGVSMQDRNLPLPTPSSPQDVTYDEGDLLSLVDIDFSEYRRFHDNRAVRRNVSLPSWLNAEAERAGVNVSAILQAALKKELRISE